VSIKQMIQNIRCVPPVAAYKMALFLYCWGFKHTLKYPKQCLVIHYVL